MGFFGVSFGLSRSEQLERLGDMFVSGGGLTEEEFERVYSALKGAGPGVMREMDARMAGDSSYYALKSALLESTPNTGWSRYQSEGGAVEQAARR